jgi:hypothetical protein
MRASDITPVTKIKNEDYWIYYVLRDLFKVFGRFIMLDTGSTDRTKEIAIATAKEFGGDLTLIEEDYGDDADKIGNSPNILREECPTKWMFLVDGDEIWREAELAKLLAYEPAPSKTVLMVVGHNLTHHDGKLMAREKWSADRLFAPDVRWHLRTDYPFESHGLEERASKGQVDYVGAFFWHTRHLTRSAKDDEAFFRAEKRAYFPYNGPYTDLPNGWLGEIGPFPNPYLGVK